MDMSVYASALNMLTKREFSVIPIRPRDKTPLLSSWREFQTRLATEEELARWFTECPDANYGIVTGAISGIIVVDMDGEEGLAWTRKHLPPTSVYQETGKGWHAIYGYTGPISNRVRLAPEIDLRGDGGYILAAPSIHPSGKRYAWRFPDGLDAWDGLTPFDPAWFDGTSVVQVPDNLVAGNLETVNLAAVREPVTLDPVSRGQRNETLTRIVGKYIRQGVDLDGVYLIAKAWNDSLDEKLPDEEVRKTINSVTKSHIRNHPELIKPEEPTDTSDKPNGKPDEDTGVILPDCLLYPGGYIQEVMDYIQRSSAISLPLFRLAAAIALLGSLIGQKVCTETKLRTNIYAVCLGYSGSGKDAANDAIPAILLHSHAPDIYAGNSFTSESALLRHLSEEEHARALALLDEMGLMMNTLKNPRDPAYTLPHMMMKLFSGTRRGYTKNYTDAKYTLTAHWHHFSFIGSSTPVSFWEALTMDSVKNGLISRMNIFDSRDQGEENHDIQTDIPVKLLEMTNEYADLRPACVVGGNLIQIPEPRIVPKTQEAQTEFRKFADVYKDLREQYKRTDEARSAIYSRVAEHAHKYALIHAASLYGPQVEVVDVDSVLWACGLISILTENTLRQITENIVENSYHKLERTILKRVRDLFAKSGGKSVPQSKVLINLHPKGGLKEIKDALTKLTVSGAIIEEAGVYGNKPVIRYRPGKEID